MTDQKDDDSITLFKNEYVVNILAMGIAVQILSQKTGIPIEMWMEHLAEKASDQYEKLSSEQIQQTIDLYEVVRNA